MLDMETTRHFAGKCQTCLNMCLVIYLIFFSLNTHGHFRTCLDNSWDTLSKLPFNHSSICPFVVISYLEKGKGGKSKVLSFLEKWTKSKDNKKNGYFGAEGEYKVLIFDVSSTCLHSIFFKKTCMHFHVALCPVSLSVLLKRRVCISMLRCVPCPYLCFTCWFTNLWEPKGKIKVKNSNLQHDYSNSNFYIFNKLTCSKISNSCENERHV